MQLAISAISSLFAGGAAAGGTAATAAATAATTGAAAAGSSLGLGSTATLILKGVAGVTSVLSGLAASNAQAAAYDMQARDADRQAVDEKSQGFQRQTVLKRELLRALGENDVQYAAAGIDLSGGVAKDNRDALETRATQELSIDRSDTDARIAMHKARAAGFRDLSGRSKRGGGLSAMFGLANTGISLAG
ncbi:hypothetical protein [Breoghania sp.]|uniref:hypothetical protein n=1 Tax=Breoghania sp. TaxID=2065378 RepID=UPI002AA8AA21|nr:hypothetical protein [Breoghania sp.]